MASYRFQLPPNLVATGQASSLLLHLDNDAWVPAVEDPRQNDRRAVGVQFGGLTLER
jgi:hypothetical protein